MRTETLRLDPHQTSRGWILDTGYASCCSAARCTAGIAFHPVHGKSGSSAACGMEYPLLERDLGEAPELP